MSFDHTILKGTSSKIIEVILRDSTTGAGKTAVAYTDVTASYVREGSTRTAITLASGTAGDAYSSGKWCEVDATNCPGLYQLHLPDAALATGVNAVTTTLIATGVIDKVVRISLLDVDLRDATDAGLSNLDAAISSRSTFDSASDQVTVSTNNDKTGYSISGTKTTLDALNDIAATAIVSGGAITTSGGAVSNVTLVATTTTNTDMRGTDGANTVAPDNASIAAILTDTGTTIPASISALNDLSQADVRTAVGLASANLDTQLGDIPTVSEFNARTLVASAYFDPATDQVIVSVNNDKTGYALSSAANDAIGAAFLAYTLTKGSPGTIERAFWQSLKATQLADGEVSGTPTASAFDTNLTAVSGAYDHLLLLFTSGSLAGEARPIDSYSSTNGRITLQEPLTSAPSSADEFIIVPDHSHPVAEIVEGVWSEDQSTYTTAGSFGYYLDSQVSAAGGGTPPTAAQIADAVWDEVRSPDHVTEGTFGYYVDAQVSSAGAGGSGLYQVTVTVQNESAEVLQGARVNVDGTTLTLVTNSSGQCVFNLDSGIYTLHVSPTAGYQTPTGNVVTITTADVSSTFTLAATAPSGDCDVPWVG